MNSRFDAVINLIRDLLDDNTIVLFGAILIAVISPEHRELITGGLIGWLGNKKATPGNPGV